MFEQDDVLLERERERERQTDSKEEPTAVLEPLRVSNSVPVMTEKTIPLWATVVANQNYIVAAYVSTELTREFRADQCAPNAYSGY